VTGSTAAEQWDSVPIWYDLQFEVVLATRCYTLRQNNFGLERGWSNRDLADGKLVAGLHTFSLTGFLGGISGLLSIWLQ